MPWVINPSVAYHASLFAQIEGQYSGVLLEFGMYRDEREPGRPNDLHYWNQDGLRFTRMTQDEFYYAIDNKNDIICGIGRKMTVRELINGVHAGGKSWRDFDYSIEAQNCQDFVAAALNVLGAYRYKCSDLRHHTFSKVFIPPGILLVLERNEKDPFCTFEKIPFVGAIAGIFAYIFA